MNLPFFAVKAYVPGGVQNQAEKKSKNAFRPVPVQTFTVPSKHLFEISSSIADNDVVKHDHLLPSGCEADHVTVHTDNALPQPRQSLPPSSRGPSLRYPALSAHTPKIWGAKIHPKFWGRPSRNIDTRGFRPSPPPSNRGWRFALHGRPIFIQCWEELRSLYEGAEPQPSTG